MKMESRMDRKAFVILCILFLLVLIPIFWIAMYVYPSADDLSYGVAASHVWRETHSLTSVFSTAWEGAMEKYQTWQGSFFAVFLMHLQPAVFGSSWYTLGTVILLMSYLAFSSLFFYTVCRRFFSCERLPAALVALTLSLLSLLFTYDPVEAFFWYNGGVYYTFFYSISLLVFSLLILSATVKNKAASIALYVCSLLLSFFVGGGNYSTALMSAVILFLVMALLAWKRRKKEAVQVLLVFVALMTSFVISMLAPGNAVRQMASGAANSPVKAILLSLVYGVYAFCNCTTVPVVVGWAFLTPFLYRAVSKIKFRFPYPLVVFLLAYGVFCTQGTPVFYALGFSMPERVIDIIYFSYYPIVLLTWSYFLGWLSHQNWWSAWFENQKTRMPKWKPSVFYVLVLLCFCAGTLGLVRIEKDPQTGGMQMEGLPLSAQAALSLVTGEAQDFHAQLVERESLYEDPTLLDVRVEPLREKPYLLFQEDITEDPDYWINEAVAEYYGKDSVALSKTKE